MASRPATEPLALSPSQMIPAKPAPVEPDPPAQVGHPGREAGARRGRRQVGERVGTGGGVGRVKGVGGHEGTSQERPVAGARRGER